jgi:hypothetical protein
MLTNLRLADLRLTTAQQRSTGQNLPSDLYHHYKNCNWVRTRTCWNQLTPSCAFLPDGLSSLERLAPLACFSSECETMNLKDGCRTPWTGDRLKFSWRWSYTLYGVSHEESSIFWEVIQRKNVHMHVSEIELFRCAHEQHSMSWHELQGAMMSAMEYSKMYCTVLGKLDQLCHFSHTCRY